MLIMKRKASSKGTTLIEVLIALIVLSIGLLGIATTQLRALQFSQSSFERSIAVIHAHDFVERVWAGRCAVYSGDTIDQATVLEIRDAWREDHQTTIFGWTGDVAFPGATGDENVIEVTVSWDDRHDNDFTHRFSYLAKVPSGNCS